jgi:hypothetical protein
VHPKMSKRSTWSPVCDMWQRLATKVRRSNCPASNVRRRRADLPVMVPRGRISAASVSPRPRHVRASPCLGLAIATLPLPCLKFFALPRSRSRMSCSSRLEADNHFVTLVIYINIQRWLTIYIIYVRRSYQSDLPQ